MREGRRGCPPYALLSMLKALYLQALHDLSDPGPEEALLDRLSFRHFCGFFGYKAHLGVDQGSSLIRRLVLSSAKTYESEVADRLICGDEGAVYGDRAYEGKPRRARLKAAGIKDRIMHRRNKHMASLPPWQQRRNDLIARRRAPVEAVFSALKRFYGLRRAKSLSLERNTARLYTAATAYNLRRASLIATC